MVLGAAEVMKDTLDLFPVNFAWVAEKLREGRNGNGDVGSGSDSSIH